MARDSWNTRLEAHLDGELDPRAAAEFTAETAAAADLQAELESRQEFRRKATAALSGDLPPDIQALALGTAGNAPADQNLNRKYQGAWRKRWPVLALAACLALVFLVPELLRDEKGAVGPRSVINLAGQVAAVRFGETPGRTVVLEAGSLEIPAGFSQ